MATKYFNTRVGLQLLAVGTVFLLFTASASATIYTFVDERGVVHMTNVPNDSRYTSNGSVHPKKSKKKFRRSNTIDSFIQEAAARYHVDPLLVKAVIKVESDFNHRAVSKKGAMGLMQLMPATASDMLVSNPFDPRANIMGGTRYLSKMLLLFNGNLSLGLAAYNSGPTRVAMAQNKIPKLPETIRYVKKVLHHYQRYRNGKSTSNNWPKPVSY
ncbi:MAG: transglycosylase SLT domain-containing protein [Desulfuromonadales bacterium]|nr:transglycosylase SLT domain-containing protein [Desulfuromonadales bacterium]